MIILERMPTMAKLTVLLGELSGSIGGITFARNKSGQYARQRVTPTNPNSEAQDRSRAAFGTVSAAFHSLTPFQKSQWQTFANSLFKPRDGRVVGTSYTGQQSYVALNTQIRNAAERICSNPVLSIGSYASDNLADFPVSSLTTAPTTNFSGNLQTPGGAPITLQFTGGTFLASNGNFTSTIAMGGVGAPPVPSAPSFLDPSSNHRVGFLLFGSEPVEQEGLAVKNQYKNLLGAIPAPLTFDGAYTPNNTLNLSGSVGANGTAPRKAWYAAGQTFRMSCLAIDMETGQTQHLGSADLVVS